MNKKMVRLIGIITAISLACGLLCFGGIADYKEAKAAENLLVNPGAETGDLSGWIDSSSEKCWLIGYEGTIGNWNYPAARSGKYYFRTGWPTDNMNRYLYQDVNIASCIGSKITFEGYIGGYGHADKGGIKLEIRDQSGKVLTSNETEMFEVSWGDWSKHVELSLDVPAGAYTARVYLIGSLHEGNEADAYFDDLSLTVSGTAKEVKLNQVKKVKLTNKKGGYIYISFKKVKGAEGYQVKVAKKKSMKGSSTFNTSKNKGYFANASGKSISYKKGQTYYAQVRAYCKNSKGKTVYGKWSKKAKVKIKK